MIKKSILAIVLAIFMVGATLVRKDINEWGEHHPCTQAVEEIAAEVNERLGE